MNIHYNLNFITPTATEGKKMKMSGALAALSES